MAGRLGLLKDGAWVTVGQIGSALGTLFGLRVLTEFVAPEIYGGVVLSVGMTALVTGTVVSPVMQAALRYYPEYSDGSVSTLRSSVVSLLLSRILIFAFIAATIVPFLVLFSGLKIKLVIVCGLLFSLDAIRNLESVFLNAARRQKSYAVISIAEAWGRPFLASAGVYFFGAEIESVLIAYVVTSAFVLIGFYLFCQPVGVQAELMPNAKLKNSLSSYAFPLVPLAGLGWINGVGDRYLIGGLLGLVDTGLYSAVYGLLSRPFLMVSGIVELTLRPHYYQLVAESRHAEAELILKKWIKVVLILVISGFLCILIFDEIIVNLLLADNYKDCLQLMPWIAGGYVFLAITDVYIKVCYAYKNTKRIFKIHLFGALLSITTTIVGINYFGLLGAAMAVPVYFGVMLVVTMIASKIK